MELDMPTVFFKDPISSNDKGDFWVISPPSSCLQNIITNL